MPSLAGVAAEWAELLGSDWDAAFTFLRPTQKLSSSYPCPSPGGDGCPRRVVTHGLDDIVAVCGCTPRQCDTLKLTKADIIVYELNPAALGASVAAALEITADFSDTGIPRTWRLGAYWPYAGFRFPVYMTIQVESEDYRFVADRLTAQHDGPFILLAPRRELCDRECSDVLQKKNAALLIMSEALALDNSKRLATQQPVEELLSGFRAAVLPSPKDSTAMAFFPTPPDASWTNVHMNFKDGHTLSVHVKSETMTCNYTQMGMAVLAVAARVAEVASTTSRFTVEDLGEVRRGGGDAAISSCQVYLCIAWFRRAGLVVQHGRRGYSLPVGGTAFLEKVSSAWRALPER